MGSLRPGPGNPTASWTASGVLIQPLDLEAALELAGAILGEACRELSEDETAAACMRALDRATGSPDADPGGAGF